MSIASSCNSAKEGRYDYIIWDWNGTLYNDVVSGMQTVNSMLSERGLPLMDIRRYRSVFCFPIIEYYRRVGFDFEEEPYEKLAEIFITKNNARLGESGLYYGVKSVLKRVQGLGIKQLILSATRSDILTSQVGMFGIEGFFCSILGKNDFFAYGKTEIAEKWLAEEGADAKRVLFVGDTVHDYEVAKAIGCDCVLVSKGHQNTRTLDNVGVPVLSSIKKVMDVL